MYKNIAFIPIRKGSKGIKNKNTKVLGDKPLFCWVLDTLLKVNGINEIWIATDSDEAELIIKQRYGDNIKVFRRSIASSTDSAPVMDVINEFIEYMHPNKEDFFLLVQATSPFTTVTDFVMLMESIHNKEADSYISCQRVKKFSWSEDGKPLNYDLNTKPMRQNYPGLLLETGAFYASSVGAILQSGQLLSGRIKIVETSIGTSIDIDEEKDWKAAEQYIKEFGIL